MLLEKASKFALGEVNNRFKDHHTRNEVSEISSKISERFKEHNERFTEIEQMIDQMSKAIGREIFQAVRRATQQITLNQQNQMNSEELKEVLTKKADRSDLTSLLEIKSNKVDLEQTMNAVDTVY